MHDVYMELILLLTAHTACSHWGPVSLEAAR
jgi:hypothetical protein